MTLCNILLSETLSKSFRNIMLLDKISFIIKNNVKKKSKIG